MHGIYIYMETFDNDLVCLLPTSNMMTSRIFGHEGCNFPNCVEYFNMLLKVWVHNNNLGALGCKYNTFDYQCHIQI